MPRATAHLSSLIPNMTSKTVDHGHLKLMEKLGEGGYGVVYRAVDTELPSSSSSPGPKEYAVKVLKKAHHNTHQWQFQRREMAAHSIVHDHPNILSLHRVLEDDSYFYLVTDYCPGGDLFTAIIERHLYCGKDDLVKKVFVQILDAVQACHEKGVFHRDIKPDNILCKDMDATNVVLADFGLSTSARQSENFGCGSSYYISPECIGREFKYRPYSPQTADVWALGIILANMIAGRNPWNYATTDDQCFLRFMANEEYLREMLPISKSANAILRRIFAFNPSTRITIPELREEILKIDTFFMSPEDIAKGNQFIQIAAATYAADRTRSLCSDEIMALREGEENFNKSENMLEGVVIEDSSNFFRIVDSVGTTASAFIASRDSDSDSGEESAGPVTPESHAQDSRALIEVPDMSGGQDMGIPVVQIEAKKHENILPVESLMQRLEQIGR